MKKWEYCREYLSKLIGHGNEFTINKPGEVDKAINDMGEKGWELVSVEKIRDHNERLLYFKREKK